MFRRLSSSLVQVTLEDAREGKPSHKVLTIRTGEAFPPTHPTSRLCLELLREALGAGPAGSLLDVGCGGGVLSLAAAALGVDLVVAVDLALAAIRETRENARENAVAGCVEVVQGSTGCIKARFELVVANLPFEVQIDVAPELDRLAAPPGSLILSGFRDHQEGLLRETYLKLGWSLARRVVKDFRHPELPPELSFTWVAWALNRSLPA